MSGSLEQKVNVVILAAGDGKRMKSDLPKVLHTLHGRPLIDRLVSQVEQVNACARPIVVTSARHTLIQSYLGARARYATQIEPKGTGHAVQAAAPLLVEETGPVIILYGDSPAVQSTTLERLIGEHQRTGATITLATATTPDFTDWRSVFQSFARILRDHAGKITHIVEMKDATPTELNQKEINPGIYCFRPMWLWQNLSKLRPTNAQKELYLTNLIQVAIAEGQPLATTQVDIREVVGVNTKDDLVLLETLWT